MPFISFVSPAVVFARARLPVGYIEIMPRVRVLCKFSGPNSHCSESGFNNDSEKTLLWVFPVEISLLALPLSYSSLHFQNKVFSR